MDRVEYKDRLKRILRELDNLEKAARFEVFPSKKQILLSWMLVNVFIAVVSFFIWFGLTLTGFDFEPVLADLRGIIP